MRDTTTPKVRLFDRKNERSLFYFYQNNMALYNHWSEFFAVNILSGKNFILEAFDLFLCGPFSNAQLFLNWMI